MIFAFRNIFFDNFSTELQLVITNHLVLYRKHNFPKHLYIRRLFGQFSCQIFSKNLINIQFQIDNNNLSV
jgi:hypothetical protein